MIAHSIVRMYAHYSLRRYVSDVGAAWPPAALQTDAVPLSLSKMDGSLAWLAVQKPAYTSRANQVSCSSP